MDVPISRLLLRGTDLRYALTRILQIRGPLTVAELVGEFDRWGFAVSGRPPKVVSDTLRWEMGRDRVRRHSRSPTGRIVYCAGGMPRSTEQRIVKRVRALREEVLSLEGGQTPLFPD